MHLITYICTYLHIALHCNIHIMYTLVKARQVSFIMYLYIYLVKTKQHMLYVPTVFI